MKDGPAELVQVGQEGVTNQAGTEVEVVAECNHLARTSERRCDPIKRDAQNRVPVPLDHVRVASADVEGLEGFGVGVRQPLDPERPTGEFDGCDVQNITRLGLIEFVHDTPACLGCSTGRSISAATRPRNRSSGPLPFALAASVTSTAGRTL